MSQRDVERRGFRLQGPTTAQATLGDAPRRHASMLLAVGLLLVACTHENVTPVIVASVTVSPPSVSAFDGEQIQLEATVRDEQGAPVSGARVTWSSDDRSVASVDANGTASAVGVGTTIVRASFQDASGSATVVVQRAPSLAVSQDSVALYASEGAPGVQPALLEVTNDGGGTVEDLGVEVVYPPGAPTGWLDVTAPGGGLPAELTLAARPDGLPTGTYMASVVLTAEAASNSPLSVPVTLSLTGLRITEDGGSTTVTEEGGADDFMVALAVEPATDIQIDVASADPGEVRVSPGQLTFERARWNEPQRVVVTGWDDPLIDGDQETDVTLSVRSASGSGVAGVVRVTTVDDDEASLTIFEDGAGTIVTESGTTDDIAVALGAQPISDVVLRIASADPGEVSVAPETLRFSPDAWSDFQTVTVTGVDDDLIDGPQATDVTISVDAASSDDAFDALADRSVSVTTLDLDLARLTISESGGGTYVTEAGSRDRFSVALGAGPATDVVLGVTSDDPAEAAVEPAMLRFTPADWGDPRPVIVTGVDDAVDDADAATLVRVSVDAAASNDSYDGLTTRSVVVITTDNDGYGITVTESDGATLLTEGGATDVVTVVLDAQPWLSDVVIDVISGDAEEVTVAPTTLRFTPSDWNAPRTVVLTGVDDAVADGDQATLVTFRVNVPASDLFYQFVPDRTVTAITADDDGAGSATAPRATSAGAAGSTSMNGPARLFSRRAASLKLRP